MGVNCSMDFGLLREPSRIMGSEVATFTELPHLLPQNVCFFVSFFLGFGA